MTVDQTDGAIDWIQQETGPWMCTVSYNSAHTPFQQPPASLTPGSDEILDCDDPVLQRVLSNLMIESMDREIARLLVSTGLAVQEDEELPTLKLEESNTVVIVVGDNGS